MKNKLLAKGLVFCLIFLLLGINHVFASSESVELEKQSKSSMIVVTSTTNLKDPPKPQAVFPYDISIKFNGITISNPLKIYFGPLRIAPIIWAVSTDSRFDAVGHVTVVRNSDGQTVLDRDFNDSLTIKCYVYTGLTDLVWISWLGGFVQGKTFEIEIEGDDEYYDFYLE